MRPYCLDSRITGVGQVILLRIPLDNGRDIWIICMGNMRKQVVRHVVGKAPKEEIRQRAICTEIFGYHHLVLSPGHTHLAVGGWQWEDSRLIYVGRNQCDDAQQTTENMHA